MRQIILDTETTGLEPSDGHRIIEIGCVELVDRRLSGNHFHQYINPERDIEDGALEVHGISREFLQDKPVFADIVGDFLDFIGGAELIIHNAPFDIGFLDSELSLLSRADRMNDHAMVLDTLALARDLHPGQRNSLDALCKRYAIDNTHRELHGALLDAEILADVYLAMTGGQIAFSLDSGEREGGGDQARGIRRLAADRPPLKVVRAGEEELRLHLARLQGIAVAGRCLWLEAEPPPGTRVE